MKQYEVQLFSGDNLVNAITVKKCDSIIQALNRFVEMCESGREDYNLGDYNVWLYDRQNEHNIIYYCYLQDDGYGSYEELVSC